MSEGRSFEGAFGELAGIGIGASHGGSHFFNRFVVAEHVDDGGEGNDDAQGEDDEIYNFLFHVGHFRMGLARYSRFCRGKEEGLNKQVARL